jgi:hypothetical protein
MKKISLLFLSLCFFIVNGFAQTYWQQEVNYTIEVTLNDQRHSLHGKIDLSYINHSPDTLTFIWFHLWPNAYKNRTTALHRQLAADKTIKSIPKGDAATGYIDSLGFNADGQPVKTEADPENIDIVKLILPKPLAPGDSVNIKTPFRVQLPDYFSRMGHVGNYYMITQWYPKPAVYDRKGWHAFPYLDRGEFYSEFGRFDVRITLPDDYIVAATGNLQTEAELNLYKTAGKANRDMVNLVFAETQGAREQGKRLKSLVLKGAAVKNNSTKTLHFTESNIHDFAFFASRDFIVQYDEFAGRDGKTIEAFTFHHPESIASWGNSLSFVKDAVLNYSKWLGNYPYATVKAVEGPKNQSSGGMEYPTVTLITSPDATPDKLDAVITHEVGHNWFYGILASNERDHAWMDEGLNTYYQFRYEAEKYKGNSLFGDAIPADVKRLPVSDFQSSVYSVLSSIPMNEAINTQPNDFPNKDQYGLVVYIKTALWMFLIEQAAGKTVIDEAMQSYYNIWKFRHPYPEDLKAIFQKAIPTLDFNGIFDLLNKKGKL